MFLPLLYDIEIIFKVTINDCMVFGYNLEVGGIYFGKDNY